VDVAIKKVSERDGKDRFVLVNAKTREVVTVHDVSELLYAATFVTREPAKKRSQVVSRRLARTLAKEPARRAFPRMTHRRRWATTICYSSWAWVTMTSRSRRL